jgi:hypothetical protein
VVGDEEHPPVVTTEVSELEAARAVAFLLRSGLEKRARCKPSAKSGGYIRPTAALGRAGRPDDAQGVL